ncbi:MAG: hypothetical protein U5R31_13905 [Acidimicrobiia bacterium]|nr:hypothetical protein [Acidimicrobiia bacterium]
MVEAGDGTLPGTDPRPQPVDQSLFPLPFDLGLDVERSFANRVERGTDTDRDPRAQTLA